MLPVLLVLFSLLSQPALAQWQPTTGPNGGPVYALQSTPTALYAGTTRGLYRSTDDGASWQIALLPTSSTTNFSALFYDGTRLYAGTGSEGGGGRDIYRSTDDGQTWTAFNAGLPLTTRINSFAKIGDTLFVATGVYFNSGLNSGVYRSTNNGQTWTPASTGLPANSSVNAILAKGDTLFAGIGNSNFGSAGVYRSTNFGATWTQVPAVTLNPLSLTLNLNTILAGGEGGVRRSTDGGETWMTPATSPSDGFVRAMTQTGGVFYAATSTLNIGGVWRSTDDGVTWTRTSLYNAGVWSLTTKAGVVWAGRRLFGLYRTADGGAVWSEASSGIRQVGATTLFAVADTLYAGTYSGANRTTNGGATWQNINNGLPAGLVVAFAKTSDTLFAAINTSFGLFSEQTLARTTTGGAVWTPLPFTTNPNALIATGGALFVGTNGNSVFRSTDGGNMWQSINTGLPNSSVSITEFAASGTMLFLTSSDGVFRSTTQGNSWENISPVTGSFRSLALNGTTLFASNFDNIYRSTNSGTSWTTAQNGLPSGISTLIARNGTLYAGLQSGGIYYSINNGDLWLAGNNGFPAGSSVQALESFGGTLYAGLENSTTVSAVWTSAISDLSLPVELLSFSASSGDGRATLDWRTASELHNAGFLILRRIETDSVFSEISSYRTEPALTGSGNSTQGNVYRYIDATVDAGRAYRYSLRSQDLDGTLHDYPLTATVGIGSPPVAAPRRYRLFQNYPNPFNPETTITFELAEESAVTLELFTLTGQRVRTLTQGNLTSGTHQSKLNASQLASGVYFYRLSATGKTQAFSQTLKLVLTK